MKLKNNRSTADTNIGTRYIGRWLVIVPQAALVLLGATMFGAAAVAAEAARPSAPASVQPVFATVDKTVITQQQYDEAFAAAARATFYHGKPPEAEIARLQREVGDKLVSDVLLLREAKRRKLKPDAKSVKQKVEQYDQRYRDNPQWQQARAQVLPLLTRQFQEESLRAELEKRVRKVPDPSEKQLRAYYAAHQDKFTAPEQQRVSLILLRVDPSSPSEAWRAAQEEAKTLLERLRDGADFAELARDYSGDSSAEEGGDMGYLHSGMLDAAAQQLVNKLKPGEISEAIVLMEGVAIFKLIERMPPKLNRFEDVRERVRTMTLAEQSDLAWKSLTERLKKKSRVRVNELRYLPLAEAPGKQQASDIKAAQ